MLLDGHETRRYYCVQPDGTVLHMDGYWHEGGGFKWAREDDKPGTERICPARSINLRYRDTVEEAAALTRRSNALYMERAEFDLDKALRTVKYQKDTIAKFNEKHPQTD